MNVENIKQPLHNAITEKITFMGVPRLVFIINAGVAAFSFLFFGSWYLLPINFVLHIISVMMTKNDSQFFEIIMAYMQTKHYYQR